MLSRKEIYDYIDKIDNLLATEDNWIQCDTAGIRLEDHGGFDSSMISNPDSNCFCLSGAIDKIIFDTKKPFDSVIAHELFSIFNSKRPKPNKFNSIIDFNDSMETEFKDIKTFLKQLKEEYKT